MRAGIVVNVTRADRHRLEAIVSDRCAPQKHVWRAQIILATAAGCGTAEIMRRSGKAKPVVWTWQARSVQRILEAHQLAPHRVRTFKLSNDPKFAAKLRDIVASTSILPPTPSFSRSTRRAKSKPSTAPSRDCR